MHAAQGLSKASGSVTVMSYEAGPALAGEMGAYGVVAGTVSVQSGWTGSVEPANDCAPSRLAMPPLPPLEKAQQQLPELVYLVRTSVAVDFLHQKLITSAFKEKRRHWQCDACYADMGCLSMRVTHSFPKYTTVSTAATPVVGASQKNYRV